MDIELQKKTEAAIQIAHSLFDRNKATGSTSNLSFRHGDIIYITASGSSFGTLTPDDFTAITLAGSPLKKLSTAKKPSKEYPLHLSYYTGSDAHAVLHTHSLYSTMLSCIQLENPDDAVPRITPYLEMKTGCVKLIPYSPPGSRELFNSFQDAFDGRMTYLLKNHGPITGGHSIEDVFYILEELEETCRIYWNLATQNHFKYDLI